MELPRLQLDAYEIGHFLFHCLCQLEWLLHSESLLVFNVGQHYLLQKDPGAFAPRARLGGTYSTGAVRPTFAIGRALSPSPTMSCLMKMITSRLGTSSRAAPIDLPSRSMPQFTKKSFSMNADFSVIQKVLSISFPTTPPSIRASFSSSTPSSGATILWTNFRPGVFCLEDSTCSGMPTMTVW